MRPIASKVDKAVSSPVETKSQNLPPVVCIVGFSGAGKTTTMIGLITALKNRGLRVGTIKHDGHGFEIDRPGKDSWRHKQAGASTTIISSPTRIGMVMDVDHDFSPLELAPLLDSMDIILIEGFKWADLPKIEVFRTANEKPPACRDDPNLLAVVSDALLEWGVPRYATSNFEGLADLIMTHFRLAQHNDRCYNQTACG